MPLKAKLDSLAEQLILCLSHWRRIDVLESKLNINSIYSQKSVKTRALIG